MKRTIMMLIAAALIITAKAQKADTTIKADTVCILTYQQATQLMQDIQIQASGKYTVNPEQWATDFELLQKRIKVIPKKEQPKK